MRAGSWHMSGRTGAPLHEELYGKTVGILGLGPIGLAAARLAKAFGTTVLGCNQHADRYAGIYRYGLSAGSVA